jgi:CheY-like chemotaxis protein
MRLGTLVVGLCIGPCGVIVSLSSRKAALTGRDGFSALVTIGRGTTMFYQDLNTELSFVPTVLYIDDNVQSIDIISRLLYAKTDWRLITSTQGLEGVDIALTLQPELILLDLVLPDINGLEVLQRLRADVRTVDTPIIMLSAEAHKDKIEECLAAGANDYFVKPCDLHQFLSALYSFMSGDLHWTPVGV